MQDSEVEDADSGEFGSPVPEDSATPDDEPVSDYGEVKAGPESLHTGLPTKIESWRRRSTMGAVLTGFALGLKEALEPRRNEPAVIVQTSGDPPEDLPVEAELEHLIPSQTVVKVRPWLLDATDPAAADDPPSKVGHEPPERPVPGSA